MKYIFLDFDGVLNSDYWFASKQYKKETVGMMPLQVLKDKIHTHIAPKLLDKVNKLVADTGATVIVSSTWRLHFSDDEINELLRLRGGTFKISGRTPEGYPKRFSMPVMRGDEILDFIKKLPELPEGIVILDDIYNMDKLSKYLVLTNDMHGITLDDVKEAMQIINTPFKLPDSEDED